MRTTATAKIRIKPTQQVIDTIRVYSKSLQHCIDVAWESKIKNNFSLHKHVYPSIRKHLPAQLAIACIRQACGMVKKAKSKPTINRTSIGYNFPRSAKLDGATLSLRLIKSREKFKFTIPACYAKYFCWDISESLLRLDRKGRCFFLFTFSKEVSASLNSCSQNVVLGIDLGINNLAVCSNGRFYNSSKVKQAKRKFRHLRSKLQAKGTRSAKRLLKKLSGREYRYMAWVNHNISKDIVANFTGNEIVIENLKGIRNKRRGRRMNYWISNWSFYQLQSFIQYKAESKGITFRKVKPNHTSKICHKCGQIGSRSSGCFSCHCGLSNYSADLNAARNLAHPMLDERQAAVTQPYSLCDDSKAISFGTADEHNAKSPAL